MTAIDVNASPASRWKNGAGVTRTVAIWPPHATLDDFDWRISIAEVASESAFSPFPGVDRTILLLDGCGMMLSFEKSTISLTEPLEPRSFPGEATVQCRPVSGVSRDFSVMTRRGVVQAEVQIVRSEWGLDKRLDAAVFFCARGSYRVHDAGVIEAGWALNFNRPEPGLHFAPHAPDAVMIAVLIENLEKRNS